METKKSKLKKHLIQTIIPILVICAFTIYFLIEYSTKLVALRSESVQEQYLTETKVFARGVEAAFDEISQGMKTVATMLESEKISEEDALSMLMQTLPAEEASIVSADGTGKNCQGESVVFEDLNFYEDIKTDSYTCMADIMGDIAIFYPVEKNGSAKEALVVACKIANLHLEDQLNCDSSSTWVAIIDGEGRIIYAPQTGNVNYMGYDSVLFDEFRNDSKKGAVAINNIHHSKPGYLAINLPDGERSISYVSISKLGWTVVEGVTNPVIEHKAEEVASVVSKMVVRLAACLVAFFIVLILNLFINSGMFNKKRAGLIELAETDQLTGLYNKITTERKIREHIKDNPDSQNVLYVIDVDNFKKINDTMGHAFGDEVLSDIGHGLKAQFRSSDIIGRAGGDEFIILLKDLKTNEIILRESHKLDLFFKNLQVGKYTKYSVSASIGACVFPGDAESFEELYKRADEALYKAKHRGKNQVAFYKDIEVTPTTKDEEPATDAKADDATETPAGDTMDTASDEK